MPRFLVTLRRSNDVPPESLVLDAASSVEATRAAQQLGDVMGVYPMVESPEGLTAGDSQPSRDGTAVLGTMGVAFAIGSILLPFLLLVSFSLGVSALIHGHRSGGLAAIFVSTAVTFLWTLLLVSGNGTCTVRFG